MKHLLLILIFLGSTAGFAQGAAKKVTKSKTIEGFIPKSWRQIAIAKGDLNKDGAEDVAIVVENTDSKNFIVNENMGATKLNLNPRQLLILFKDKGSGYYSLAIMQDSFIPEESSEENPCLADPLLQDGGVAINKGTLVIDLHDWVSCGSYWVGHATYIFRYQDGKFMLIGYDKSEYSRASGEKNSISINFVTKKKSSTTGDNVFENGNPKTVWKDISINKLLRLEDINRTTEIEY